MRRRFFLLHCAIFFAVAVLLAGGAGAAQEQAPLNPDAPDETMLGDLRFLGAVVIPAGPNKVGGLSDLYIEKAVDTRFLALSDSGKLHEGRLIWEKGRLTGAMVDRGMPLLDENGKAPTNRSRYDSESLTRLPNGEWLVGFERDHRIERFQNVLNRPGGVPKPMPKPPGLADLPRNEGLEALTALPGGGVLAIAEAKQADGLSPAWLWQEGHWSQLTYRARSGFVAVDATVLPSGDVLVLERSLNLLYGFRSRIVRVKAADLRPDATLDGQELAVLEYPRLHENFEGIHAVAAGPGAIRIYIVSDNNYNLIQRTILAAFELKSP